MRVLLCRSVLLMCALAKKIPAVQIKLRAHINTLMLHNIWVGYIENIIKPFFRLLVHESNPSTMLLRRKKGHFHFFLVQPAAIADISISSLWWHSRGLILLWGCRCHSSDHLAARAAGSVRGRAALVLEVKLLTPHQSEGGLAPRLAAGLTDSGTCGPARQCTAAA